MCNQLYCLPIAILANTYVGGFPNPSVPLSEKVPSSIEAFPQQWDSIHSDKHENLVSSRTSWVSCTHQRSWLTSTRTCICHMQTKMGGLSCACATSTELLQQWKFPPKLLKTDLQKLSSSEVKCYMVHISHKIDCIHIYIVEFQECTGHRKTVS